MTSTTSIPESPFFGDVLKNLQLILVMLIGAISVISKPRHMLLEVSYQANIPIEFRMVAFSIPDYFMLALLLATLIRLAIDPLFRERITQTATCILWPLGGVWWLILLLIMIASIFWSRETALARFTILHAMAGLAMAFIIADLLHEDKSYERWALGGLLVSACIQAVVAFLQAIHGDPIGLTSFGEVEGRFYYETETFFRARGLAMHPNYLGGYLMVALFACVILARRQAGTHKRGLALLLAIAILVFAGLLATLSRSAILATGLGLFVVMAALYPAVRQQSRLWLGSGVVLVGIAAVTWVWIVLTGNWQNIQHRFLSSREFFWEYTLEVIKAKPLQGSGAGNLMMEIGKDRFFVEADLLPAHNVYLFIWGELGIIAALFFAVACITILLRLRAHTYPDLFIWTACFLAIAIIMLFDNYFWAVHPFRVFFFWSLGVWWFYASSQVKITSH